MTTSGKITFTDWREDYAYILDGTWEMPGVQKVEMK